MNKTIANILRIYLSNLCNTYVGLLFRFEYSQEYETFIVSYNAPESMLHDATFCRDLLQIETKLNDTYGDDAPLFTEKERLFTVSDQAEVVECKYAFPNLPEWHYIRINSACNVIAKSS